MTKLKPYYQCLSAWLASLIGIVVAIATEHSDYNRNEENLSAPIIALYGIVTSYFSVFKLWFTLRASARAATPETPILFLSRLWKRVHVLQSRCK